VALVLDQSKMLNGRTRRLRETNCPNHVVGQAGGDSSIRDEKTMVVPEHDDRTDSTNSEMPLLRLQVPARAITPASPRSSPSAHAREPRNHSGTELADARDREHSAGERKTDTATCGRVRRVS